MAKRRDTDDDGKLSYSQVMMLLESIEKQVQVIAEQYGSINEKLNAHGDALERLERDMETVKIKLASIERNLTTKASVEDVTALKERLAAVEAKLS